MRSSAFAAIAAAAAMLAAPVAAQAADPPTILTAGIDAAGTTFDHVSFATSPEPDPGVPSFFLAANFAAFGCGVPPDCDGSQTATSFKSTYPIARDRRYFLKVAAGVPGVTGAFPTSAVWIIDESKPVIGGKAPVGEATPTGSPATGRLFAPGVPPAPPPPPPPSPATRPRAKLVATRVPKTFAALRLSGVRLRVTCNTACSASGTLRLGGVAIGRRSTSLPRAGTRTITVRPSNFGRRRLSGRSRARLRISAKAKPAGGATVRRSRSFTVVR
jgi:hypothetical protein